MSEPRIRVLLIEDNTADARLIGNVLTRAGTAGPVQFDLEWVPQLALSQARLATSTFDVILLDLVLPDSMGYDTFFTVRRYAPQLPIIVLTGLADEALALNVVRAGAQDYIVKGHLDHRLLTRAIRYAIERQQVEEELARYREHLEELVEERTSELFTANERLQGEIDERQRAQEALSQYRDHLEEMVKERTTELTMAVEETLRANERLQQEIDEHALTEEVLRRRNRELVLLNRVGHVLSSSLDPDEVMASIIEQVRHLEEITSCSVWLVDPATGELVCRQVVGPASEVVRGWRLAPGQGLAGWVAQTGESRVVSDAQVDARHFAGIEQAAGLVFRAILCVPMRARDRVIGVIESVDTQPGRFGDTDLRLLEALAASAATAIENAQLFATVARGKREWETTFDAIADGISLHDADLRIIRANQALAARLGVTPRELVGRRCFELLHGAAGAPSLCPASRALASGQVETVEWELPTLGGFFQCTAYPLGDEAGRIVGVVHMLRDITGRKAAEEALRESEARFRALFENAPQAAFEVDLAAGAPVITRTNRQAERVYGTPVAGFISTPLTALFVEDARPDLERLTAALRAGEAITLESLHRRRDGALFPVRISASTAGAAGQALVTVEDITTERERRSENEAIAEERRRIAREIHDGLAQNLASLRFRVRLWHDLVDQDPQQLHAELDELRKLLEENIREVRRSIFALRPLSLDELGFYPALRQFVQDLAEQSQLPIDLQIRGPQERLPASLEPVLFRLVQEALNNVGKHAQAHTAWVELDLETPDTVRLRVRDDGIGFDPAALGAAARTGHLGLAQMRERVALLTGTFTLQSAPGQGTAVQIVLPFPPQG